MADYVERYSGKASDKLEKQIRRVYKQAAEEVQKKLDDFIRWHKARNAQMLQMVSEGKMSKQDYQRWMRGQVFQGDQWKQKLKDVTEVYVHADEKAREIVGGTSKNVFMEAANYTAYDLEKGLRGAVAFNVYDAKTVERLLRKDPKMLPEWKIDQPKDYTWNEKRVRNAVTQGIIQGESIEEVGERLTSELATSNAKKMDMFARTAVNGAQNAGRMDRLHEAEEMGIEVRKKWLATLDQRTRDTHQALDGQEQPIDEPFVVDGMKIDYPGDPLAPPELVYNCRCTLTYVYPKYQHLQHNHERRDQLNDKNIENMTYYEWIGLEKRRIANNDISFVETEKVKKVECPYKDEMSDKGYVGLSASESDEFIKTYHNKRIIGKKGSNTMDGTQSRRINSAFRNGETPTNPADIKFVQKLDAEIKKNELPQNMTLFRGVSLDAFSASGVFDGFEKTIVEMSDFKDANGKIDFDKWGKAFEKATNKDLEDKLSRAKKLIGTTIEDKGYMQVSASSQRNIFAASDIGIQIHAPKGTNAYISDYLGESEIILERGTSYRVLDATIATTTLENGNQVKNIQLIVEIVDESTIQNESQKDKESKSRNKKSR